MKGSQPTRDCESKEGELDRQYNQIEKISLMLKKHTTQ